MANLHSSYQNLDSVIKVDSSNSNRFGKMVKSLKPQQDAKILMALTMDLAALFAGMNIVLLLGLMYIYGRIALRTKAAFSIGLLTFSSFLFVHNSMTVYSYLSMAPFFGDSVLPYLFATSALEFGGLAALLRITL